MILRRTWQQARCRIMWLALAVLLYLPYVVLTGHR